MWIQEPIWLESSSGVPDRGVVIGPHAGRGRFTPRHFGRRVTSSASVRPR